MMSETIPVTPKTALPLLLALALPACVNEKDKVTFFSLFPPSTKEIAAPANLPPENFQGEFWVDRQGCSYIRTASGEWVPRMNLDRTRMCDASVVPSAIALASTPESGFETASQAISVDPKTGQISQVRPELKIPTTYVQVGSYSETSAGLAVREKFASLGFPVVGRDTEPPEGRAITVVLGPYQDSGFLEDALDTAKSLGHNDAYVFQNQ